MSEGHAITPVFLYSLPRAGSTLLQRLLELHNDISTGPEPWILLSPLFARRERGALATYGHTTAARAIDDLLSGTDAGEELYSAAVRRYAQSLYDGLGTGHRYFVDKTPRYHHVVNEIMDLFPEAKHIFLWRNPLAVAASMIRTFGDDRWIMHRFEEDLHEGLARLLAASDTARDRSISVKFEDLVTGPDEVMRAIWAFLDVKAIDVPSSLKETSGDALRGRLGDKLGVKTYSKISEQPVNAWVFTMNNPLRKAWCRRYMEWLGGENCARMGYDFEQLEHDVASIRITTRRMTSDVVHLMYGRVYRLCWRALFD